MAVRAYAREIGLFRQRGGGLRTAEALRLGINRKTPYAMRDAGVEEPFSRWAYRLASLEPLAHPDLTTQLDVGFGDVIAPGAQAVTRYLNDPQFQDIAFRLLVRRICDEIRDGRIDTSGGGA